ncbi:glycosyltransferase family 2 protein [Shewanella japonica]|uniref:glycosyltransferase family 2 protein n=1 Tax=Shewanella japonica TaxID=93973 RepID=UPI0024940DF5|nr:glycosyltransferase family 2 protein [Shewanella japonica]
MSEINGFIENLTNGIIRGWVVTAGQGVAKVYCGDRFLVDITSTFLREDIIEAGLTDGNAGFAIDITEELGDICGEHVFTLTVDEKVITEVKMYVPSNANLISNPYFELSDQFNIQDSTASVSHRVGQTIQRFVSPNGLKFTNGGYTRIAFGDKNNSKEAYELKVNLSTEQLNSDVEYPLELGLVTKASHLCNVHIRLVDINGICLFDEPFSVNQLWDYKKLTLPLDLSQMLKKGLLSLTLRTKHYGRRNLDFAMLAVSESLALLKTPKQLDSESKQLSSINQKINDGNAINNGNFTSWPHGVCFPVLKRGQELAKNWFVEMNKGNETKLNVAVVTDQNQVDPLASTISSNLGVRFRANDIQGYARIITTINKSHLTIADYLFKLDVEAMTLNKKALLPRIYLIARNSVKDVVVADIARKETVQGRQLLSFSIPAKLMEKVLQNQPEKPVLALAIDAVAGLDISIYSASLIVDTETPALQDEKQSELTTNGLLSHFTFEDESITSQLDVLKGLDLWSTGHSVTFDINESTGSKPSSVGAANDFQNHLLSLTPHKMQRPTRDFPFIDIIVPVYNACDDVLLCLSALVEKTDLTHRVIVINDGQDDRTATMLAAFNAHYSHIEVITNPENIGYTKSVNKGIKNSNSQWVVVLNSDTIVSEGWLGKLMNCALSADDIGMVGALSNAASWQSIPRIHDETGDWHLNPLPNGMSIDNMAELVNQHSTRDYPEVGVINGFCQLINLKMLDQIGLLDEVAFPVGYGEENDMCARAVKAGYKLLIADDTYIFHAKSKSFGHEKRKVLAKQGSAALKKKHPDVDWNTVTKVIRENPALNTLRENMVQEFNHFESESV